MTQPSFEVPAQLREFMEKSVEHARSAFEAFAGAAQKAVSPMEEALPSAAKEVSGKIFAHSQANFEAAFDFAKKLAQAKDPQEVMQIHNDFVKAQTEALQHQAKELGAAVQNAIGSASGSSSHLS